MGYAADPKARAQAWEAIKGTNRRPKGRRAGEAPTSIQQSA